MGVTCFDDGRSKQFFGGRTRSRTPLNFNGYFMIHTRAEQSRTCKTALKRNEYFRQQHFQKRLILKDKNIICFDYPELLHHERAFLRHKFCLFLG